MPTVKSPEERGPLAAWAYESRTSLDLSPEAVVHALGKYNPATIRKAEADSKDMSAPLWRSLVALYSRLARDKSITLAPVPISAGLPQPAGDLNALIRALEAQTRAIEGLVRAIEDQSDERLAGGQATALFLGVIARALAPQGTDFDTALRSAVADLDALRHATNGAE